ncbi:MAG: hypothetical protein M5T61_18760 [Acidimicrobiia bacterium]|nr:hypothetical protein [Acidimicrobiia bacterium]
MQLDDDWLLCGAAIAPGLKDETPVAATSDTEATSRRATPGTVLRAAVVLRVRLAGSPSSPRRVTNTARSS